MTHELILTSVAQGLYPNDHGFCPVAADTAISPYVVQQLSALSSSRRTNTGFVGTRVAYAHLILPGRMGHVLSRTVDSGVDFQGEPNVLTHHIVLEGRERNPEGPAWLLALPNFHVSSWHEPPMQFVQGRPITTLTNPPSLTRRQQIARQYRWLDPQAMSLTGFVDIQSESYLVAARSNDEQIILTAPPTTPCPVWNELAGDPGWGGVLAETAFTEQPVVLICNPEQNILPLFVESLALLPPYFSWQVTFSTHWTQLPEDIFCQWKGVIAGSDETRDLTKDSNNLVLDLTVPMGTAFTGHYLDFARHGQEHMVPQAVEEHAVAVNADTKFDEKETRTETDIFSISLATPPAAPPNIQLPRKRTGLLELFLRRSSRFQFYFLYSMMFLLVLFLLMFAVDQAGHFGLVRTIQSWNQPPIPAPPDNPNKENESDMEKEAESVPEKTEQNKAADSEIARRAFEENREKQQEPLIHFLETFTVPDFLPLNVPNVQADHIDVPEKKTFAELSPFYPFGSAWEIQFIPLFNLPNAAINTSRVLDALPDLVWQVEALDTGTGLATPMFRFQLTRSGLEMNWQPEGLNNQYLYETILSSLGFLRLGVADSSETVEWKGDLIPLFAPVKVEPIFVSDMAALADSETPEYVVASPFAAELWQNVFAEKNPPHKIVLEIRAEPAGDWAQIESLSPSEFGAVVNTSQEASRLTESGETVFENIQIPFIATASLEQVVWKEDEYANRLNRELTDVESQKEALEKKIGTLQNEMIGSGRNEADVDRLKEYQAERQALIPRLDHVKSILEKLPDAHHEMGQNVLSRFHYSVFLESADGGRKLLVLTTSIQ